MISRQYAAWLAMEAIYDDAGRAKLFDQLLIVGNDVVGVKTINDTITFTPEGTYNFEGWVEDFEFLPRSHPVWGNVHGDFYDDALAIYHVIKPMALTAVTAGCDVSLQGHSRGGGLVDALASMFALDGIKVTVSMFEAPRFGWSQYAEWANRQKANGIINVLTSTTNGPDPVVLLPPFPWVATYQTTELKAAPGGLEDIDPIAYHMSNPVYPGYLKMYPA